MVKGTQKKRQSPYWVIGTTAAFIAAKLKALLPLFKIGSIGGSVISMLLSVAAFAIIAPIPLAIGLVVLVLVHEMGHVGAAWQKGLPTSAPIFIPLIGAMVNMKRHPRDAATEAYIAIGGPAVGTIGALVVYAFGYYGNNPMLTAIAYVGFILNLINLLPMQPLDGGKIVIAVSRWLWLAGLLVGLAMILYYHLYVLILFWLWFAWDLFHKYIRYRGQGQPFSTTSHFEIQTAHLIAQKVELPNEDYQRELVFRTYSELNRDQKVLLYWEEIGFRGQLSIPDQGLIKRAFVNHINYAERKTGRVMVARCQVDYERYEYDGYYEVPTAVRWGFGLAYMGLVILLLFMIYTITQEGFPILHKS